MQWLPLIIAFCSLAVALVGWGVTWGTTIARIGKSEERIKELEAQQADKTAWAVGQHEKRLDAHDALFTKIGDKLDAISAMVERIDQRTAEK